MKGEQNLDFYCSQPVTTLWVDHTITTEACSVNSPLSRQLSRGVSQWYNEVDSPLVRCALQLIISVDALS